METAFDEFLGRSSKAMFGKYRQDLVSSNGNFSNGKLSEYMNVSTYRRLAFTTPEEKEPLDKLFLRREASTYAHDYGFVFNMEGTEKLIKTISGGGDLKIYEDYRDLFLFYNDSKRQAWLESSEKLKKRLIADDLNEMVKKTNLMYRTHGDRMHYLVVGKVITKEHSRGGFERNVYPLFLFACSQIDRKRLVAEIEQGGFINFWLDERILENEIAKTVGGLEVSIDQHLPSLLTNIQQKLNRLNLVNVDQVDFDPTFSMIGIVNGFEAEYVDLAWKEILK